MDSLDERAHDRTPGHSSRTNEARAISMVKAVDNTTPTLHLLASCSLTFCLTTPCPGLSHQVSQAHACDWLRLDYRDLRVPRRRPALQGCHVTGIINDDSVGKAAHRTAAGASPIIEIGPLVEARAPHASFRRLHEYGHRSHSLLQSLACVPNSPDQRRTIRKSSIESHTRSADACRLHPHRGKPIFPSSIR